MRALLLFALLLAGCSSKEPEKKKEVAVDPLPSWNNTATKKSIVDYVTKISKQGSKEFIPMEDRIATFDNDGTIWAETPVVQLFFTEVQSQDMGLKHRPIEDMNKKEINDLFVKTHTGMTDESFTREVKDFFTEVKHPQLNVPFNKTVYKPQLELMKYLAQNGFKIYIVTGGTADFMRVVSKDFYGIPPEQVIGSGFEHRYDEPRNSLMREPKLEATQAREAKAYNIQEAIGKRPVFAVGNVRSGGDIYMLRYSQGSSYPNFQLLVNHDDANREFAYQEKDGVSLLWAQKYKWNILSMKNDWKTIFPN
jgi:phosphoglycolate phosphatase-like HAD superfamily hydrolase